MISDLRPMYGDFTARHRTDRVRFTEDIVRFTEDIVRSYAGYSTRYRNRYRTAAYFELSISYDFVQPAHLTAGGAFHRYYALKAIGFCTCATADNGGVGTGATSHTPLGEWHGRTYFAWTYFCCGGLLVKDIARFDDRYSTILRQMS